MACLTAALFPGRCWVPETFCGRFLPGDIICGTCLCWRESYMMLPVLRSWISHARKENLQYFLMLFFIFQIGKETCLALRQSDGISFLWSMAKPDMVCGYLGYFVLGYYLSVFGISRRLRRWIYAGGLCGIVANVVLDNLLALRRGTPVGAIYDSFGLFTFLMTVSLFLLFNGRLSRIRYSAKAAAVIREISLSTLGVYLMHIGLLEFLKPLGIHSMMFTPVIGIPVFALFCYILCSAAAAVLRRILLWGDICAEQAVYPYIIGKAEERL